VLSLFSPLISGYALSFGPAEYFTLMVLGLIAASAITEGSAAKGLAMVVLGILLATVGMDPQSGTPRFTFGTLDLMDGLGLSALAMGLFGISEVISSIRTKNDEAAPASARSVTMRSLIPSRDDIRRSWM